METAVDFASRLIDPQAIKDAGHSAVLAYMSTSRPGSNFGAKPITKLYADQVKSAGLDVVSVWQYGKPGNASAPSDWTTGYDGGYRMGLEARDRHFAAGGTGYCPIFFAVDENISLDQWNSTAVNFFKGLNAAIGQEWTGIYGCATVVSWAMEDGVIGKNSEGKFWAWQTKAWSGGVIEDGIVLYQRVVDTASNPGPQIDGSAVDVNDIMATDFGQWGINRAPHDSVVIPMPKEALVADKPEFTELDRMGNSASSRNGARITNWLLHTQEGNGTAESLAAYLNDPSHDASYHYTVRDGDVCDVVDTDLACWAVLDANPYTINACFAGSRAAWSRDDWLSIEGDIAIMAWLAVQDAKRYGFSTEVIAPPYHQAEGISDHKYVTQALGIGTHTDVGPNFPWDVLKGYVDQYASGAAPAPKGNAINDCETANDWLGARKTTGENVTPDGRGRWAEFDKGYIYWTSATGAHAIPLDVFAKWGELRWETGPLGYPINDHASLGKDSFEGTVQGFEFGTVYVKNGRPGHWIHGDIGARWARSGYENGPLGWPTSDEASIDAGAVQHFEKGTIYWAGKLPTIAVLTAVGEDTYLKDA